MAGSIGAGAETAPSPIAVPIEVLVDGDVGDATAVRVAMEQALARIDREVRAIAGTRGAALEHRLPTIRVRRAFALAAHKAASSTPGVTEVRPHARVDAKDGALLAHEAAHQFLWSACPATSTDALFHEAFAVWASGEAALWLDGEDYLSLPRAHELLNKSPIDSRAARRALARLIMEERDVPTAIAVRLRACADGAAVPRLAVTDLAAQRAGDVDVTVVLQRATGEVVVARGDSERPLPYGSTLKPLVVAGARMAGRATPTLAVRATDPSWACQLPDGTRTLDVEVALLKSCNGWFLDWAARDAQAARLGDLGPLLLDYGLSELPASMEQAIGVQASLSISAHGLALAYRALSWARPDVVELLEDNAVRGTLAGVQGLSGVATKTGTVRGLGSAPTLAWLVAVTDDVVVVRARDGVTPRALADDVAAVLAATPRAARTARVQTFGLLPSSQVMARCDGRGAVVSSTASSRAGAVASTLETLLREGAALCTGPWLVSFRDDARARPYLGVFSWLPPPPRADGAERAADATPRQQRARRGSDFVLATSLGRYTGAVLAAEDSAATGAARDALARVIAHNAEHSDERHPGRPLCDTTHCQVLLGTAAAAVGSAQLVPLSTPGFLPFSQGGDEAWRAHRPLAEWRAALQQRARVDGTDARVVGIKGGAIALLLRSAAGDAEEVVEIPCEPIRNALRLPSCPASITVDGTRVLFAGAGAGHGLGLDVERAKRDGAAGSSADDILRDAYGAQVVRGGG